MNCEYCNNNKELFANIGYNDNSLYIDGDKLILLNLFDYIKTKIKFCPMCGKEIEL